MWRIFFFAPFPSTTSLALIVLSIFFDVVLPVFILIGIGALVDRLFQLDLETMSKLNFYVFVPGFVFMTFLQAQMPASEMLRVAGYVTLHLLILFLVAAALFKSGPWSGSWKVLALSASTYNCGNYGLPFALLAFPNHIGIVGAIVPVIIMVQMLLAFTMGVFLFEKDRAGTGRILAALARVPVLYAILLAILVRYLHYENRLPVQLEQPLTHLSNALVPIALMTVGVQIARCPLSKRIGPLLAVGGFRFIASPLLTVALTWALGIGQPVAGILTAMSVLPTAVNVYIIAAQYQEDQELASQAVFWTTLLSAVTVSVMLALVR